jgi:hypothetical protein
LFISYRSTKKKSEKEGNKKCHKNKNENSLDTFNGITSLKIFKFRVVFPIKFNVGSVRNISELPVAPLRLGVNPLVMGLLVLKVYFKPATSSTNAEQCQNKPNPRG